VPKTTAGKLGITPGATVTLVNPPEDNATVLAPLPDAVTVSRTSTTVDDVVVLFARDLDQLRRDLPPLLETAGTETKVWVAYRKGRKGPDAVTRDALMPAFVDQGWHGVSLISLDETWSAARFRRLEQIGRR
jgi:hypothetical protein